MTGWTAAASSVMLVLVLHGCSTRLGAIETLAQDSGFVGEIVHGSRFDHRVFRQRVPAPGAILNIYIEGDGSPYRTPWIVNDDPTPARPVMLELMALDPGPAAYVGRPCYFGLSQSAGCGPGLWTLDRFSEPVVDSLSAVVESEKRRSGSSQVRLFGHSGGGALAVLLARQLGPAAVIEVVTVAGNLDHERWTGYHGYASLTGSLNPVDGGPLPPGIRQLHLFGTEDRIIPPGLMRAAAEDALGGRMVVVPGMRHTCCWETIWPAVLAGQMPPP